jgi:hypothetical protein
MASLLFAGVRARPVLAARALATSQPQRAGMTFFRTSIPQMFADAWHGHLDCKIMFSLLGVVLTGNFITWVHGSGDPRFHFGRDQKQHRWKKYMTEKQWCQTRGLGLNWVENNLNDFYWPGRGAPAWDSNLMGMHHLGFKEAWRRDVYRLVCDIETYKPKACPRHPLPLGGCAHPANANSELTKFLKHEGEPLMWCENCVHH